MKVYHYYLVSSVALSYLCDAMFSAIAFISLQPLPCLAFLGVMGPSISSHPLTAASTAVLIVSSRCAAIIIQCIYRILQAVRPQMMSYPLFYRFFHDHFVITYFLILLMVYACIWGPMLLTFPDQDVQKQLLLESVPIMADVYERFPHIQCVTYGTDVGTSLWIPLILAIIVPIFVAGMVYGVYKQVRKNKHLQKTNHLHRMLLRSLIVQILVLTLFICLPAYTLLLLPSFGVHGAPRLSVYCVTFYFMETNVECLMLLWFVRPYREQCRHILRFGWRRKGVSLTTVITSAYS
ncbi:unnamed protein product [Bursaphelenchus xylophilus]|uniref:(pine wood nematode) hypothetical protein n=1 Tax=Bursaphelenchus xylophilus TaxID=6326 RepID=A0A1I7S6W4_BURXY|nr:unnamed protein product [Bursaphelenchus xylophilus]CAG9079679.1 unnamed protein product [Bursaphelenchus xylophilus]